MNRVERQAHILQIINQRGFVENEEFARLFFVTQATIRRDIKSLAEQKLIQVEHGGSASIKFLANFSEPRYETKYYLHIEHKRAIAAAVADLIKPGETIILDSGTTNLQIAKFLKQKKIPSLTVITSDIQIARELCNEAGFNVIVLGGVLRKFYYYTYGYFASVLLENLRADKFLLGADAVHVPGGIASSTIDEIIMKQSCIRSSHEVILVIDSSKFKRTAPYRVCTWKEVDWIVTDDHADTSFLEYFQHQGLKVLIALTKKGQEYDLISL